MQEGGNRRVFARTLPGRPNAVFRAYLALLLAQESLEPELLADPEFTAFRTVAPISGVRLTDWRVRVLRVDLEAGRSCLEEGFGRKPAWRREIEVRPTGPRALVTEELTFARSRLRPLYHTLATLEWDAMMRRIVLDLR